MDEMVKFIAYMDNIGVNSLTMQFKFIKKAHF